MPKKKIDYAAMYSYDPKTGLYYTTRTINGKRRKFRSKDPEALHEKISAAEQAGARTPTFRDVADEWKTFKWQTIRPKTQECYTAPYNRAVQEYGDMEIDTITAADVNRLIVRMKNQGFASQTVKDQKAVLNMIFNHAIAHDPPYIQYNPCAAVTVPRGLPKTKRSAPEEEVITTIVSAADKSEFGLFPLLLLFTGCRRGEALALTWGDIDYENNVISINKAFTFLYGKATLGDTKTFAGNRTVPLLSVLRQHLVRPEDAEDDDLIFTAPGGKEYSESTFKRHWRKYCIDAGLYKETSVVRKDKDGKPYEWTRLDPTITPHQLRHAYATLIFESGTDAKIAQSWLGHADLLTTQNIYTDLRAEKARKEITKFAKYTNKRYSARDTKGDTKAASG